MIFISYRRAESESVVGRLYSELKKHFPTQDVFLDHESIPLGKPFLEVTRERLATSKFVHVLIGPQWCSIKDENTGWRSACRSANADQASQTTLYVLKSNSNLRQRVLSQSECRTLKNL